MSAKKLNKIVETNSTEETRELCRKATSAMIDLLEFEARLAKEVNMHPEGHPRRKALKELLREVSFAKSHIGFLSDKKIVN